MTSIADKIIKPKLGVLQLDSVDSFYRFKQLYETGGEEALQEISRKKPNVKDRVPDYIEHAVVELAIENPALGQARASHELSQRGIMVSASGVRPLSINVIYR
jgi:hypothetical protein